MKNEKNARDSATCADTIAVSDSARRQIGAKVLESKKHSAGAYLGPSFVEGFPDVTQNS
jgi:hypothetical protein